MTRARNSCAAAITRGLMSGAQTQRGRPLHVVEAQGPDGIFDKQVPVRRRFVQKVLVFKVVEVSSSTVVENVERVGEFCLRTAGNGRRRGRHWYGLRVRKSLLSNALKRQSEHMTRATCIEALRGSVNVALPISTKNITVSIPL
jgi:hypothetical protein